MVWRKAHSLARLVYRATATFPREEQYGITSQLRRAALSISTNIVEGQARGTQREFARFLTIARASAAETDYLLLFCVEEGLIGKEQGVDLRRLAEELQVALYFMVEKMMTSQTISETVVEYEVEPCLTTRE